MNDHISICIPTFARPDLLAEALKSCALQDYPHIEIVIGDDSTDTATRAVVDRFTETHTVRVVYRRNVPGLGQNANVARLFAAATGDRIVLLHDDDRLLPGAVAMLASAWQSRPDLAYVFGTRQVIAQDGTLLEARMKAPARQGPIAEPFRAALLLQFPSDAFMIRTSYARRIGYRSDADVGVYCDKDFSLRLGAALAPGEAFFFDEPLAQYRISDDAVSNSPKSRKFDHARSAIAIYESLDALAIPSELAAEKAYLIDHLMDKLVKGYATSHRRRRAFALYASGTYGWKRRLTPRGLYHLALIGEPRIDTLRRYEHV